MNKQNSSDKKLQTMSEISDHILTFFSVVEFLLIIIELGYQYPFPQSFQWLISLLKIALLISYLTNVILHTLCERTAQRYFGLGTLDFIVILAIIFFSINLSTIATLILIRQVIILLRFVYRMPLVKNYLSWLINNPAQLTMFSFMIIITIGTILLTFPVSTKDGNGADVLTALFTATSATCVTGLIVVDTGTFYSTFGQIVILGLIQIGGLGIMTLSTSLVLVFGRRVGLREQATLQDLFDIPDALMLKRIIIYIVKMTFWVELVGAVILFFRLAPAYESFSQGIYSALFHSISAFCNAGFSLFADSLVRYQNDWVVNLTICGLIIIGGIGFTVVANLLDRKNFGNGIKYYIQNLNIHTRIVLITTTLLISVGTILIFFFEFDNSLIDLSFRSKLLAAFFQSVTARTAGFNTIDMSNLKNITILILVVWMFIGAAPGSTGGGIKVSTLGVLVLTLKTLLGGRRDVEVFRRTIPQSIVYKSVAIVMVSLSFLGLFFGFLLILENKNFAALLFEATSAFGTVGLSLGITSAFSPVGRLVIIGLMYIGRIGPLTLTHAISDKTSQGNIRFPNGRIMVG